LDTLSEIFFRELIERNHESTDRFRHRRLRVARFMVLAVALQAVLQLSGGRKSELRLAGNRYHEPCQ